MSKRKRNIIMIIIVIMLAVSIFAMCYALESNDSAVFRVECIMDNAMGYFVATAIESVPKDSKHETTFITAKHCTEVFREDIKTINLIRRSNTMSITKRDIYGIKEAKDRDVGEFKVLLPVKVKIMKISDFLNYKEYDKVKMLTRLRSGEYLYYAKGEITAVDYREKKCLTNIFCRPGNSGSPVLNTRGHIVGIVSVQEYAGVISGVDPDWRPMGFAMVK